MDSDQTPENPPTFINDDGEVRQVPGLFLWSDARLAESYTVEMINPRTTGRIAMDDIGYTDRLRFWWYSWRARMRVDKLIGPSVVLLVPLAMGVLWIAGDQNAVLHVIIALWVLAALCAVAVLASVGAAMVARYRLRKLVEAEVARTGELHVRFT